jgi:hypothetical protein
MYLTSLTHREELFEIASRWFRDRYEYHDGRIVSEIFAYERMVTGGSVRQLVGDLCQVLEPGPFRLERVLTKDAVRESIIARAEGASPRVREIAARYLEHQEELFPRTPVYMSLVTDQSGRLLGMIRRKRIRRIAEKVSRRVADQLAEAIDSIARGLAAQRARGLGIAPDQLVSSEELMAEEFTSAERIIAHRFKTGEAALDRGAQRVDDVVGIKLIGTPAELERIEQALAERDGTMLVEREIHSGCYNGTHLLVDLELPPVEQIVAPWNGIDWSFVTSRGLTSGGGRNDLIKFIERGSHTFRVELILTTFDDLAESELGCSIHESRVLEQRQGRRYKGRIAQNASYIIEYLLRLAVSPTVNIHQLPIKMWGRYLPDTLASAVVALTDGLRPDWLLPPGEPNIKYLESDQKRLRDGRARAREHPYAFQTGLSPS